MIEVGEYIRHKKGYIYKAKSVYKDMIWWCDLDWIAEKDIVKHSKNIIDLIEVRRLCKWKRSNRTCQRRGMCKMDRFRR